MSEPKMIEGYQDDGETIAAPLKNKGGRPRKNPLRPEIAVAAAPQVRPAVRSSSAQEAEEYARSLMASGAYTDEFGDEFYIDPNVIPDGWSYEWKRVSTAGKDDNHHMLTLLKSGWREVPVERHPELMPAGATGSIEKKGLRLMELPKVLTDMKRDAHIQRSKDELRNSDRRLHETPANTAPREEFPDRLKKHDRDWYTHRAVSED